MGFALSDQPLKNKLRALLQATNDQDDDERSAVIKKFISDDLRLKVFPSRPSERHIILEYLALRLFSQSDNLQESQVNERLKVVTDDFATLRRYLIDAGLLERLNDGTSYQLGRSVAIAQTL